MSLYENSLRAVGKKFTDPCQGVPSNTIVFSFGEQAVVRDCIKCLAKVEYCDIHTDQSMLALVVCHGSLMPIGTHSCFF